MLLDANPEQELPPELPPRQLTIYWGGMGNRHNPLQLKGKGMVGDTGFEPVTSCMSSEGHIKA